jgi:CIC family chloride channel protein
MNTPKDTSQTNEDQPHGLDTRVAVMAASLAIGVLIGLAAIGFLEVVRWAIALWDLTIPLDVSLSDLGSKFNLTVAICLTVAALVAGQVLTMLENGRPHGPADLILAAQRNEDPNLKAGFQSTFLALNSLIGGSSVGMFGPLVHFGGCLSAALRRWGGRLALHLPRDIVLGSGAAAAISAAFLSPIGAAVFAHEAIVRRFGAFGAGPIILAAFGGYWTAKLAIGQERLFDIPATTPELGLASIGLALVVGVAVGVASIIYIKSVTGAPAFAKSSGIALRWRPLIPAGLLILLSPIFPHLLGPGLASVDLALTGQLGIALVLALIALKIIATSACVGFGLFGGIFAPALFLGAMVGSVVDLSLVSLGVDSPHSFAMLGAASCIAAVIGAPLASIIMVFEITGSYEWTVLAMLSVVTTSQISRAFVGRSLFDRQLALRGIQVRDDQQPR